MKEQEILQALQTGAIAAINGAGSPLPIKAIGRTLSPSPARYWEFVQIVNNMQNEYWGGERVYRGMFRLILHWQPDEAGAYPAMTIRDSVALLLPKGSILRQGSSAVQLYDHPDAGSAIESGAELLFPVSLPYRSFAKG